MRVGREPVWWAVGRQMIHWSKASRIVESEGQNNQRAGPVDEPREPETEEQVAMETRLGHT